MSEVMEQTEQTPPQDEIKTLQDLGEKIIEGNPQLWGLDGEFSIFKRKKTSEGKYIYITEKKDGKTKKVIDNVNFNKWMRIQLAGDPEDPYTHTSENTEGRKSNKLLRLLRRKTQPPLRQETRAHYGNWTGHMDDMVKFTEYNSETGRLRFKRKEYQQYIDEITSRAKLN